MGVPEGGALFGFAGPVASAAPAAIRRPVYAKTRCYPAENVVSSRR